MAKLQTLQVARGVAVNLVVLAHLHDVEAKYTAGGLLPPATVYGVAAVDLFFVRSGFIMVAVAGRNTGPLQFLWRRAAKIYPTYWLVSLAMLTATIIAPAIYQSSSAPVSLWRSFLLVPSPTLPLLTPGWTLIHELYFYLVFAILLALRVPASIGLIGWGLVILAIRVGAPDQVAASPVLQLATSPLTAEFMMGVVVRLLWTKRWVPGALGAGVVGFAALVLLIFYLAPTFSLAALPHFDAWRVVAFGLPSALILYALAASELRRPQRPPSLLVALGGGPIPLTWCTCP